MHTQIDRLLASPEPRAQAGIIEHLSGQAIQVIRDQGLSDGSSDFLLDHAAAVNAKIKDSRLGERLTVIP